MPLNLNLANFGSRSARKAIGNNGIRRFARSALEQKQDEGGNIFQKAWNGFGRFTGFLIDGVKAIFGGLQFALGTLWGWFVSFSQFIWNFNWNASDEELDKSIVSSFNSLGGTLGGTLGSALGYLACGAVPGAILFAFNEPMGAYVLREVGEEAFDEIAGNVAALIRQTGNLLVKASVTWLYKNIRNLWRKPDSEFKRQLIAKGNMKPEDINKALADRNKPWSFALFTENLIESIPNEFLKNFVEELLEEFADSCIEAGYVVTNSMDSYLAMQKLSNDGFFGKERTIEITLNRDAEPSTTP